MALRELSVTSDESSGDGFQITFSVNKGPDLDYDLLTSGDLESFNRISIGVQIGTLTEFLIDGVITHHQIDAGGDDNEATLVVTGKDVSVLLDTESKRMAHPGQSDSGIVEAILGDYSGMGIKPDVTATSETPTDDERIPRQHETDLEYIKRLAERNGYVFYMEPKKSGTSTAYWGPKKMTGEKQKALSTNMIASTNVESISFTLNSLAPVETEGKNLEAEKEEIVPIAPASSLNSPALSATPIQARRRTLLSNTAKNNAATAATVATAEVTNAPDPVGGRGTLNTLRYGRALRARSIVGVRGAGKMFDGDYRVKKVTHTITKENYTQSFEISREGIGARGSGVRV